MAGSERRDSAATAGPADGEDRQAEQDDHHCPFDLIRLVTDDAEPRRLQPVRFQEGEQAAADEDRSEHDKLLEQNSEQQTVQDER